MAGHSAHQTAALVADLKAGLMETDHAGGCIACDTSGLAGWTASRHQTADHSVRQMASLKDG
jgi:hypothetical protein